jgi:hypothetical protein
MRDYEPKPVWTSLPIRHRQLEGEPGGPMARVFASGTCPRCLSRSRFHFLPLPLSLSLSLRTLPWELEFPVT